MLSFSFFTAVFFTISWIMYIGNYIYTRLNGVSPTALGLTDLAVYTTLAVAPLFVIWGIWGSIYRFRREKNQQKQFKMIEAQFKQNQEFLEIVARLLYQGQQSRHSQFVLGQTELFINELNGLIADMLQRYNFISDSEAARLWTTAEKGNKWGFAKALINLQNSSVDFENRLYRTARRESLLRGTVNEFCARYARLLDILKQYDREKIFLNIIETGAFGKAFAILAPLADRLQESTPTTPSEGNQSTSELFAEVDMRIDTPAQTVVSSEDNLSNPGCEDDPLAELEEIEISDLTAETETAPADIADSASSDNDVLTAPTLFAETSDVLNADENEKNAEEFLAEAVEASEKTAEKQPEQSHKKDASFEEEISSMFAGAGIRGEDDDSEENEEKPSFFPSFGNLFKRRAAKEKSKLPQDEIDPLTLALERSFGKLSDSAPISNSRLAKVMKAEENSSPSEEKDVSGRKFAFASTNQTILKLQQELEQLKTSGHSGGKENGTEKNAAKEDN